MRCAASSTATCSASARATCWATPTSARRRPSSPTSPTPASPRRCAPPRRGGGAAGGGPPARAGAAAGARARGGGGPAGRVDTGEYVARVCRDVVAFLEAVTDEGYAFRVDLRLRPEGRMGAIALALERYRAYYRDRGELWERQALLKARVSAGDPAVGARFMDLVREAVYRPGVDARVLPAVRAMKREIDR